MGKVGMFIVFVIVIAALTAGVLYFVNMGNQGGAIAPVNTGEVASSNGAPMLVLSSPTGTATSSDSLTYSDGTITFTKPGDFNLATTQEQVLVRSYIPPCDPNFNYCLYYDGTAYQGTNFDSAGIRIEKRTDLTSSNACLTAPPTGYSSFTPTSTTAADYAASEFTPLGNAGAGHYSIGTLYRLWYDGNNSCYEFETRIGQSQFANYPSGTVQQFTAADQNALQEDIDNFMNGIVLSSGETVAWPR